MKIEIKVPAFPESVADAIVSEWHKKNGEVVKTDELLVDLETDKIVMNVPAPKSGILVEILKKEGTTVKEGDILGYLEEGTDTKKTETPPSLSEEASRSEKMDQSQSTEQGLAGPAARRLAAEQGMATLKEIQGTGKSGRITSQDVIRQARQQEVGSGVAVSTHLVGETMLSNRSEKRVPMTRLRARIAERLLAAQHNAAILTTFNEINLHKVIELRTLYQAVFEKKHKVRLGFMSFFTKAVVEALKEYPSVNASIDGNDVLYHDYIDIGIAVSTERGLVVPILRDAGSLGFAEIERKIADYATKAKENQIKIEDITGGTFTITNGGVFGSLLATPIINPPQSAILGMNKIEKRPIVENDQIVIRPMMYVGLSYDHRIIDGKESVSFLKMIKEYLEDPSRILLGV